MKEVYAEYLGTPTKKMDDKFTKIVESYGGEFDSAGCFLISKPPVRDLEAIFHKKFDFKALKKELIAAGFRNVQCD